MHNDDYFLVSFGCLKGFTIRQSFFCNGTTLKDLSPIIYSEERRINSTKKLQKRMVPTSAKNTFDGR